MKKTIFEEMGGTYTLAEDGMYYPDIILPEDEKPRYGKYGRMRKAYLKEYRQTLYMELLLDGKLVKHLNEIDEAAHNRVEMIVRQMAERQGIDAAMKVHEQLKWGECLPVADKLRTDRAGRRDQSMNNCKNAAEEIVLNELIYN